ncbi:MAG: long-chain fatty acid--CoA ligase [Ignavibacteriae bacterium]|nr:MAG: long-chain fatty acid--CoA ligase [Ignavibacteriota bacterium]
MVELKKLTLEESFKRGVELFPDNLAISGIGKNSLTFKELAENVKKISEFLKEEGITNGDKVAILSDNSPNWAIAYFSITTIGAVAVPIMTEFQSADVHHVLRHSAAKVIFVSKKLYEKIGEFNSETLTTKVLIDDFSIIAAKQTDDIISRKIKDGKKEFGKILDAALKFVGAKNDEIKEDDLAAILYTSGTTGHSKGVMLTHKNIVYDAVATSSFVDICSSDRMLSMLPLAHTMECTLGLVLPLMVGASVYYLEKPPTASHLLPALLKVKPTIMVSVPLIIEKIYKMKILPEINKKSVTRNLYKVGLVRKRLNKIVGKKLLKIFGGSLRMFCIGGATLPSDVEKFLQESRFPYALGYGLTETSPLVTGTDNTKVRFGASGTVLVGMEVKIDEPDPATGVGEILIKGPNVMKGYYKDPEKTKDVFDKKGWFKSGDLGLMDKDGYLFIKGRSKNVIIGTNGKNIYPEEIESVINENPFILESLVYETEQKIAARVHLNYETIDKEFGLKDMNNTEARKKIDNLLNTILSDVNKRVATFSKINKIIEQPEPFVKTPTKKIKRYLYT